MRVSTLLSCLFVYVVNVRTLRIGLWFCYRMGKFVSKRSRVHVYKPLLYYINFIFAFAYLSLEANDAFYAFAVT